MTSIQTNDTYSIRFVDDTWAPAWLEAPLGVVHQVENRPPPIESEDTLTFIGPFSSTIKETDRFQPEGPPKGH
jgi:hypothetical protein